MPESAENSNFCFAIKVRNSSFSVREYFSFFIFSLLFFSIYYWPLLLPRAVFFCTMAHVFIYCAPHPFREKGISDSNHAKNDSNWHYLYCYPNTLSPTPILQQNLQFLIHLSADDFVSCGNCQLIFHICDFSAVCLGLSAICLHLSFFVRIVSCLYTFVSCLFTLAS